MPRRRTAEDEQTLQLLRRFVLASRTRAELADLARGPDELVDAIECELAGRLALDLVEEGRW